MALLKNLALVEEVIAAIDALDYKSSNRGEALNCLSAELSIHGVTSPV